MHGFSVCFQYANKEQGDYNLAKILLTFSTNWMSYQGISVHFYAEEFLKFYYSSIRTQRNTVTFSKLQAIDYIFQLFMTPERIFLVFLKQREGSKLHQALRDHCEFLRIGMLKMLGNCQCQEKAKKEPSLRLQREIAWNVHTLSSQCYIPTHGKQSESSGPRILLNANRRTPLHNKFQESRRKHYNSYGSQ